MLSTHRQLLPCWKPDHTSLLHEHGLKMHFYAPIALIKDRLRTGDFAELGGSLIVQRGHGVIGHADDAARFRPLNCAQQRIAGCIESSRQSVGGCRVEQHRI